MKVSISRQDNRITITMADDLTIYHAADIKRNFVEQAAASRDITLDLSTVTRIDTAAFQLIVFLGNELAAQGHRLTIAGLSGEAAALMQLYGYPLDQGVS